MNTNTQHLVIGATGKTGSRVIMGLRSRGYKPRAASRNGEVLFDWNDETTWTIALNGIDSVYLTYYPDLAIAKAPGDISKFCTIAKLRGVKHITLLSGRGEPAAQTCESIVRSSGMSWTIVRASWFNQNFSEGMFREFIMSGTIALPVDSTREPFIDVDDIAAVIVESLTDPHHNGKLYNVTGPELLNFEQLADKFTQHLGRTVNFQKISLAAFRAGLAEAKVDHGAIEALTYLFTEVLDGRNEHLCNGVQQALGRAPKSFDQYIIDNKQFFSEEI